MKNIVLIGMPAAGKSTVGVVLAKLLGYNFVDTDILLALEQRRTLPQIIVSDGYDAFIRFEGAVGESLKCENTVIATGGSMVFSGNAMKNLAENGILIWLDAPVDELERRMAGTLQDRGVASPEKMTLREIYTVREPLYRKYAALRIPCEGSSEYVANVLKNRLSEEKLI
ncbi:MAG: shikimate kinase [Oscillospiraceae bacterium]|nr:shikimate kinase [Oscillospiraceae bacterium]